MSARIAEFDPDVILFCGFYSPLAAALYNYRPVLGLNVHAMAPLSPVDVWLSSREAGQQELPSLWKHQATPPVEWEHPYRIKRTEQHWTLTRTELGIEPNAVVWITVGGRLEHEISGPWAERVANVFANDPGITWLLVGGHGTLPAALTSLAGPRLKVLGSRDDVGGLLQLSDIYVNPLRMGGGFSVAEAMAEGLPVVSFADSDGGDKLGAYAVPDLEQYLLQLRCLSGGEALRQEVGHALRTRFKERLDLAQSKPSLVAALNKAVELARLRLD